MREREGGGGGGGGGERGKGEMRSVCFFSIVGDP